MKKEMPDEIEEFQMAWGSRKLVDLLTETGLTSSKGEARRLVEQGGVRVNGEKATAASADITLEPGDDVLLQVGKLKFLKVTGV